MLHLSTLVWSKVKTLAIFPQILRKMLICNVSASLVIQNWTAIPFLSMTFWSSSLINDSLLEIC
jgi:hypothetical protein